ncbi:hypothetical protein BDN70DRAFT_896563 [Pholiota conissans]|uniref:Uncharacterized protein n=1 Tax=Pholiota conissans TaxID=109636 RepID=A0A9P5YXP9_9AGAR|nr:hypothetical protein BDN70DRAFT_896563 [Pholiota conissans]
MISQPRNLQGSHDRSLRKESCVRWLVGGWNSASFDTTITVDSSRMSDESMKFDASMGPESSNVMRDDCGPDVDSYVKRFKVGQSSETGNIAGAAAGSTQMMRNGVKTTSTVGEDGVGGDNARVLMSVLRDAYGIRGGNREQGWRGNFGESGNNRPTSPDITEAPKRLVIVSDIAPDLFQIIKR